jgi:hypothetical protein
MHMLGGTMTRITRVTLGPLFIAMMALVVAPTAMAQSFEGFKRAWVTTTDGREEHGRITSFTHSGVVMTLPDGTTRSWSLADVSRIDVPDGLRDGVRKGAIVMTVWSAVGMLFIASVCGNHCEGLAPMAIVAVPVNAALGAGVGAFIDAAHVRRNTIYSAMPPKIGVTVSPMVTPRAAGVQVAVAWPRTR